MQKDVARFLISMTSLSGSRKLFNFFFVILNRSHFKNEIIIIKQAKVNHSEENEEKSIVFTQHPLRNKYICGNFADSKLSLEFEKII